MNILCTMPGRFGDILWALPTVRAISESHGVPVDLAVSHKYQSICALIAQQPYIRHAFGTMDWEVIESAPITPRIPLTMYGEVNGEIVDTLDPLVGAYDRFYHLGYESWPTPDLPRDIHLRARTTYRDGDVDPLDLGRPWITCQGTHFHSDVIVGFSDEYFELKFGVCELLEINLGVSVNAIVPPGSRWDTELHHSGTENWEAAAAMIKGAKVFLGCASALHVLACALGKQVVAMEPNVQRHNPIFWPYGTTGRVLQVLGGDGLWTWDARHVADTLRKFTTA